MKTNFKRLFALLLTLCMLASLMVPVAFAEDEAVTAPSATVAETYQIRLKDLSITDVANVVSGTPDYLMSNNGKNYKTINLKAKDSDTGLLAYNDTIISKIADFYADGTLDWKFIASEAEMIYRMDWAFQTRVPANRWFAMQIRVSESGKYALNIATDKNTYETWTNNGAAWAGNVTAYLIPLADFDAAVATADVPTAAEGEYQSTAEEVAVAALIAQDKYYVGTQAMAADETSVTFAQSRMEAGEYIVVCSADATAYPVCEMSLLGDPYELEEVASYALRPYDLTNTDPSTYAGTYNEQLVTYDEATGAYTYAEYVSTANVGTASRYADLGWKHLAYDSAERARKVRAYQPEIKNAGSVQAITINVPESGEMYLSMTTDRSLPVEGDFWTNSGPSKWTGNVTAYLVPISELATKDLAGVKAAMTPEKCVGTRTLFADETTVTFDKTLMEAGEYALIYTASEDYYAVCEMNLWQVAGSELPESEKVTGTVATYDFQVYNNERYAPIFNGGNKNFGNKAASGLEGVYEAGEGVGTILNREYAAGFINWRLIEETLDAATLEGENQRGLRLQMDTGTEDAPASGYIAFYLNVPATGVYSVDIDCTNSKCAMEAYVLDAAAAGDIANNLTEENLEGTFAKAAADKGILCDLDAGENIIVLKMVNTVGKIQCFLKTIELSIPDETVSYNFGLSNDANFVAALREAVGDEAAEPKANVTLKKWSYTVTAEDGTTSSVEFNPYTTIASLFAEGKMNWALDASSGTYGDTLQEDGTYKYSGNDMQNFRGGASLRLQMESEEISYAGLRINVPTAGTYNITTSFTSVNAAANLYLIKAPNAYDEYVDRLYAGHAEGRVALRDLISAAEPFASTADGVAVGTYTFETAGEYILAIVQPEAKSTNLYLTTMVMEPAEVNYIADGAGYESFEAAVENATESVILLQNTQAGELVVPAGVTLDLNGYMLYATSVDATAPGAQIVDAQDGKGLIRGEIEFAEDNAQLPLYDIDADGYKLFNVDVVSSATTGTGSATKYWFKVNFSNSAAFDLIGMNTELRVMADMTGVIKADSGDYVAGDEWAAVATADVAFTNAWAANNTSYIVVSAVGSNLNSFRLSPAVTANGVIISGSAMSKGTA